MFDDDTDTDDGDDVGSDNGDCCDDDDGTIGARSGLPVLDDAVATPPGVMAVAVDAAAAVAAGVDGTPVVVDVVGDDVTGAGAPTVTDGVAGAVAAAVAGDDGTK